MKIKIRSKKILKSPSYDLAARFEKNELLAGLAGVLAVFLASGFIFYFIVLPGLKTEVSVFVREVKVNRVLLEEALIDLNNKTKVPTQGVVIDPFQ